MKNKTGMSDGTKSFFSKLRKKRIIEILAAFIAGGWLIIEFVDRILVAHWELNKKWIDVTFFTLLGALICTLVWRWFSARGKPRKFKLELVLIPLVALVTILLDINLVLHMKGHEVETVTASQWKNSIAVLPFDNISQEQGQDYFCEGLTEELITRLSYLKELKVIAKTSAYAFKGKEIDIREIGKRLNVATVLEGGVRKAGNKLRITAQLINVSDGSHLWSDSWDKELIDIFAIQNEIALAVADKLSLTLLGEEKASLARRPTENIEAYNLCLQGRFLIDKGSPYLGQARDYFSEAIKLDPNCGLAYAGLADVYTYLCLVGGARPNEVMPKAIEAAHKALKIDDKLVDAHLSLAFINFFHDWDWAAAEAEYIQAIELNPNSARAYSAYSTLLAILKRFDEALEKAKRGEELNPLSAVRLFDLGDTLKQMRQYDKAVEVLNKVNELDPNKDDLHWTLWLIFIYRGMYKDAIREMEKIMEIGGIPGWHASPEEMEEFRIVIKERGWQGGLEWNLNRMMETAKQEYLSPFLIAQCHVILGHKDEAIKWLEIAYSERDLLMPYLNTDAAFDPIRNDSRFIRISKRMGLEM